MLDYLDPLQLPKLEAMVVSSKAEVSLLVLSKLEEGIDPTLVLPDVRYVKFINDSFALLTSSWLSEAERRVVLRVLLNKLRSAQAVVQPVAVHADRQLTLSGEAVVVHWQDVIGFDARVIELLQVHQPSLYQINGGGANDSTFHPSVQTS